MKKILPLLIIVSFALPIKSDASMDELLREMRELSGGTFSGDYHPDGGPANAYFQNLGQKIQEEAGIPSDQQVLIRRMNLGYSKRADVVGEADSEYIYVNEKIRNMPLAWQRFLLRHEATHIKYGDSKIIKEILNKLHPYSKWHNLYGYFGPLAIVSIQAFILILHAETNKNNGTLPPSWSACVIGTYVAWLAGLIKLGLDEYNFKLQQEEFAKEYRIKAETRADQEAYTSITCADCLLELTSGLNKPDEELAAEGYFTRQQVEDLAHEKKLQLKHRPCYRHG